MPVGRGSGVRLIAGAGPVIRRFACIVGQHSGYGRREEHTLAGNRKRLVPGQASWLGLAVDKLTSTIRFGFARCFSSPLPGLVNASGGRGLLIARGSGLAAASIHGRAYPHLIKRHAHAVGAEHGLLRGQINILEGYILQPLAQLIADA